MSSEGTNGRIHSIETCGAVDGPGIRVVVFAQGCALRCLYCHNPESRSPKGGVATTAEEVFQQVRKYRSFMRFSGGGLTLSGGEPLLQPDFSARLLELCRAEGIHTALDTSGFCELSRAKPVFDRADLVLLDLKSFDPLIYRRVTGVSVEPTLRTARYLDSNGKPLWIRFVLVPGITDQPHNVEGIARFTASLKTVQRVEILPFHQLAESKWECVGMDYELKGHPAPTRDQIDRVTEIFRSQGVPAA